MSSDSYSEEGRFVADCNKHLYWGTYEVNCRVKPPYDSTAYLDASTGDAKLDEAIVKEVERRVRR
jgi:hypothetical protein